MQIRLLRLKISTNASNALMSFSTRLYSSKPSKPFEKILIANRGEIACRVMKTAKRMGIKTVAIYSEQDANSKFVSMADEAYCVGTAASKDSYLRMDRIVDIAKKSGAQGIHPGYGFLSENATFVDIVESAGIAFIGPSSGPMRQMGDKINSKKVAQEAGCFIIPGYAGEVPNEQAAADHAKNIGYPVMIKASAGGGGKGMRVAYDEQQVREGFRLSKAEALSSFGDDRMLIERFIEDPHHIEIQVLADAFGNVVAFPERECSVQRRNQKVVEESPSCLLTQNTRRLMQEQAAALCRATAYKSAGTVEMLADGNQNFYFLEMNTRLQVEHPITELVSGEDLVEHMLWIAAGHRLPNRLLSDEGRVSPGGWALESRIYAEDPLRGFMPSIGPLLTYKEPTLYRPAGTVPNWAESDMGAGSEDSEGGVTVRVDTGVREGDTISVHYDPMIAKLCTHAPTRAAAIAAMETALDEYCVSGLVNNIPFVRSIMRNQNFRSGTYCTKFIGQEYPAGFRGERLTTSEERRLVAAAVAIHIARSEAQIVVPGSSGQMQPQPEAVDTEEMYVVVSDNNGTPLPAETVYSVSAEFVEDSLEVEVETVTGSGVARASPEETEVIRLTDLNWANEGPLARVMFAVGDGEEVELVQYEGRGSQLAAHGVHVRGGAGEVYLLRLRGAQKRVEVRTCLEHKLSKHLLPPKVRDTSRLLLSPMPGTLVSVSVKEGQAVQAGQQVAVVEAMKMQNVLRAPKDGIVKRLGAVPGSPLRVDQVIVEFD